MDPLESLWRTYDAVSEWIRFADTKAAVFLGAEGVLVGFIASGETKGLFVACVYCVLYGLFAESALITAYFCTRCLNPILTTRKAQPSGAARPTDGQARSLIYFGDIAICEGGAVGYAEKVCKMWGGAPDGADDLCRQIYTNSCIATSKFSWVKKATWSFAVSVALAIILVFV